MFNHVFNFGRTSIKWIFGFFAGLTTIYAITSPNLIVGDNKTTGAGTTLVTAGVIITILVITVGVYSYAGFQRFCKLVFIKHATATATILLALVVVWQVVFVTALHPPIGWDASALHKALTDTTSANMRSYYSQNFNNLPVVLLMHQLTTWLGSTSWLTLDYITMVMVDLSALFNIATIAVVSRKHLPVALYVHALWLVFFPTIIVPYTDAWVLPLVSLIILGYAVMRSVKSWWGVTGAIPFATGVVGSYFMKPSAIVPLIAIVLVEILFALSKKTVWKWRRLVVTLALTVGLTGGAYVAVNTTVNNQTYIQVDKSRAIPPIHFVSMGVSGDGGYNAKDALMMAVLPTKKARSDYSMKKLKDRIGRMGAWGYVKFLFMKHRNNTADGSFAWDKEGDFIDENPKPTPGPGLTNHLQQFIYLYGTNLGDFRWITQLLWAVCLILIVLAWDDQRRFTVVLRVAILGAFAYLLLFEGGRSRYLIQYLPAFLLLVTLTAGQTVARLRGLFTWGNTVEDNPE